MLASRRSRRVYTLLAWRASWCGVPWSFVWRAFISLSSHKSSPLDSQTTNKVQTRRRMILLVEHSLIMIKFWTFLTTTFCCRCRCCSSSSYFVVGNNNIVVVVVVIVFVPCKSHATCLPMREMTLMTLMTFCHYLVVPCPFCYCHCCCHGLGEPRIRHS